MGYLRLNPTIGITYSRPANPVDVHRLSGSADSSHGGNAHNRKSMYGWALHLNGGPVMVKSGRQSLIADSSALSEYYSFGDICKAVKFSTTFLDAIFARQALPIIVLEDSTACISIATNPMNTSLTRSWDIRLHIARDHVLSGLVKPVWIASPEQYTDMLTKPVAKVPHRKHRAKLLNCPEKPKLDSKFDATVATRGDREVSAATTSNT